MKNFMILTESINFIEQNLREPITREEIANHCYVSLSTLEKLFRYALNISIKEYLTKRRITQAANQLVTSSQTITEIALDYQFNSIEVFSRAFKRVWDVAPSEFRVQWRFTGIFPKIDCHYEEGVVLPMTRKKWDMSNAYDYLFAHRGCCVLCFDAQHLMHFNKIATKAGDLAILEMAARIDRVATPDMLMLRIGGDEFALITDTPQLDQAEMLAEQVLRENGKPVLYEGQSLSLSLWCAITRVPESLHYGDFFMGLQRALEQSKCAPEPPQ